MALQEGAHPPVRNGMGSAQRAHLRKRCISLDAQLLPLSAIRHSMPVDSGYSKHVLGRIACTLASLGGRTSTWPSDCSLSHTCQTLSFGGKAQVNGTVKRSRCSHAGSDIWVQAAPKFVTTKFGQNFHRAHSNGHRVSRTPSKRAISLGLVKNLEKDSLGHFSPCLQGTRVGAQCGSQVGVGWHCEH